MKTGFCALQQKQIVEMKTGAVLGCADDLLFCTESAQIQSLVIFGRSKCFGLLGREPDFIIPWDQIQTIGEDTILVCCPISCCPPKTECHRPAAFWQKWKDFWR